MQNKRVILTSLHIAVISIFLLGGCVEIKEINEVFPDTDIVFQSGNFEESSIGFVNADGSSHTIIPTEFDVNQPIWSRDGTTIYFIEPPGGSHVDYPGRPNIWIEGEGVRTCKRSSWRYVNNIPMLVPDTNLALMVDKHLIQLVDLYRCKVIENLFKAGDVVVGASLSLDGKKIVYSQWEDLSVGYKYAIRTFDLESKEVSDLSEGINPAWSSDNEFIAYTWKNGIYVMAADGSDKKKLISYNAMYSENLFEKAPPAPQWSPDGKWIIYHKCLKSGEDCHDAFEFSIYKLNIATKEEIKIVDDGLYPYWRGR